MQPKRERLGRRVVWAALAVAALLPLPLPAQEFEIMEAFEKVVAKAPYQAQATTEISRELADGNRIERKTTTAVYRDGRGRMRREIAVSAIGASMPDGEPPRTVVILDPAAGLGYQLDAPTRVARKLRLPPGGPRPPGGPLHRRPAGQALRPPVTEPLGRKTIEGIEADGTRTTSTIPAGEVGNARPIEVVHERWYSPELQTVVLSKRSDPRFGTTTFRLTGITRAEPDPVLFEVPPGYTITDAPERPPGRPRGGPGGRPRASM